MITSTKIKTVKNWSKKRLLIPSNEGSLSDEKVKLIDQSIKVYNAIAKNNGTKMMAI